MILKEAMKLHEDAPVLLSFVIKKSKAFLFSHPENKLALKQKQKFLRLLKKRQQGMPIAYLAGEKEFFGLKFLVNRHVLIPRPETETLVELVLTKMHSRPYKRRSPFIEPLKILDIGTGSGCIIISLVKDLNHPSLNPSPSRGGKILFYASDISPKALMVAKKNARRHKVKINFKQGYLLEPWKNRRFNIIVANLPYGWKEWKNNTSAETVGLKFEPQNALFTKKNGLAIYEKLFEQIAKYYNPPQSPLILRGDETASTTPLKIRGGRGELLPKLIALEFDPRQLTQIKKLALDILGPAYKLTIFPDLSSRPRVALLELP